MATNLQIKSDPVPSSFCPINNADWTFLVGLLYAVQNGDPSINFGSATPTADKQDRPWVRTNNDGTLDGIYTHALGVWVKPHPMFPGAIILYDGDVAAIPGLDGGTGGVATTTTGPFWEKINAADGRFPIQPGTMPSGAVIGSQATGGEELHTLLNQEVPSHTHPLTIYPDGLAIPDFVTGHDVLFAEKLDRGTTSDQLVTMQTQAWGGDGSGNTTPHNNLPPYYGAYLIKRTQRLYYVVV